MTHHETFGQIVKRLRKEKGWTAKELIARCMRSLPLRKGSKDSAADVFSSSYIARIENYEEIPSLEVAILLAHVLGYDVEKILDIVKEEQKEKFVRRLNEKHSQAIMRYREAVKQGVFR